jgi:hypothetical protein
MIDARQCGTAYRLGKQETMAARPVDSGYKSAAVSALPELGNEVGVFQMRGETSQR